MASQPEIAFLKSTLKLKVAECAALRTQIKTPEAKKPKPATKPTTPKRKTATKK